MRDQKNRKKERKISFNSLSLSLSHSRIKLEGAIGSRRNNYVTNVFIGGAQELVEFGNIDRRSNFVMSNVESSGGQVFEEVEFCELSSQKRIR